MALLHVKTTWTAWAWGWECLVLLGGIGSFAALVAVLAAFNGREIISPWLNVVTLNAIVSVLSLSMKASLAYLFAECIAQWKWILFAREARPLIDFERIDAATRGPIGSSRVLTRTSGSLSLKLGAVLSLLIIGLDPFSQQLLQFRPDLVKDRLQSAVIPLSLWYNMGEAKRTEASSTETDYTKGNETIHTETVSVRTELPLLMQSAILAGLSGLEQRVAVQCPTGNCTWPTFTTLGVCHRCHDVTADLRRVAGRDLDSVVDVLVGRTSNLVPLYRAGNKSDIANVSYGLNKSTTAYTLPNGHFIANSDRFDDLMYNATSFGTGNPNETNTMKDIDTLIWAMSLIYPAPDAAIDYWSGWPDATLRAMECAIYYCLKNVTSSMQNSQLTENITEVPSIREPDSWQPLPMYWNVTKVDFDPPPSYFSLEFNSIYSFRTYTDLELRDPTTKRVYRVGEGSVKSISSYLQSLFLWNRTLDGPVPEPVPGVREHLEKYHLNGAGRINGASWGLSLKDDGSIRRDLTTTVPPALKSFLGRDLNATFHSLSTSMTNELRRGEGGAQVDYVEGRTLKPIVVYDTKWAWMALHGTTLLLAVVFFGITLWNSAGAGAGAEQVPLWKSSTLATMRRGYEVGHVLEGAGSVPEMERLARKTYIGKLPSGDLAESAACIGTAREGQPSIKGEPDTDCVSDTTGGSANS